MRNKDFETWELCTYATSEVAKIKTEKQQQKFSNPVQDWNA